MRPVIPYVTAALLFGAGVYGVLRRRNAVLLLMAVELMLNAVNVVLVTADTTVRAALGAAGPAYSGQVFALFVIVLAAAEVGVGLAIVLQLYRLRASVVVDDVSLGGPARPADAADRSAGQHRAGQHRAQQAGAEQAGAQQAGAGQPEAGRPAAPQPGAESPGGEPHAAGRQVTG